MVYKLPQQGIKTFNPCEDLLYNFEQARKKMVEGMWANSPPLQPAKSRQVVWQLKCAPSPFTSSTHSKLKVYQMIPNFLVTLY